MLNRRILRVKAFQTLYAYEQCKASNLNLAKDHVKEAFQPDLNSMEYQDKDLLNAQANVAMNLLDQSVQASQTHISESEDAKVNKVAKDALEQYLKSNQADRDFLIKNMVSSAERIPQLYLSTIQLLISFSDHVATEFEKKRKFEDKTGTAGTDTRLNLAQNKILARIKDSKSYQAAIGRYHVSLEDIELEIKEWFREYVKPSEEYQEYLKIEKPDLADDLHAAEAILKRIIFKNEVILNYFVEKDLNWVENKSIVRSLASKVLKNAAENDSKEDNLLPELAINWEEDREFFQNIFKFTLEEAPRSKALIAQKTQNWDIERLAFTDKVIISMALAEMKNFPSIPVKVSINEYIDISKTYSTPKSKQFVNGLLDVISKELTESGEIRKSGRGLLDNK
ncbi:transcription antitermination factor NusB [Algoriphagus sediminis]|uniref:Transcription antitermination factor NusB n=1 Tax=Algoriphagus sediminis TaxID=3057113 RepID=A0ABT7YFA7_9BACT|nr:transcription antitermination factor NusB [Algoriphagus sediminis]MDN3204884.1 transcription antitermination factor NusB [Algoriphagus sediminis]